MVYTGTKAKKKVTSLPDRYIIENSNVIVHIKQRQRLKKTVGLTFAFAQSKWTLTIFSGVHCRKQSFYHC